MPHVKRKGIRYRPTQSETCELVLAPFDSTLPRSALLHDQSDHGCSLLCVIENAPNTDDTVLLKIGGPEPIRARITYATKAAEDVHHIGCAFLGSTQE